MVINVNPSTQTHKLVSIIICIFKEITYGDLTDAFPYTCTCDSKYIHIMYDYDANANHPPPPTKNKTSSRDY